MKSKTTKLAIACAITLSSVSSTCEAGPVLDWLFPNRATRRATSNAGQLTYRIPLNAYQYNASGYSPTTNYRSVWAPIPVTQYRPVNYVNPLSTGTQTNMLPCSTQQWQARRVPYTTYQPSSLFGGGAGWQGAGQVVPGAGYPSATAGYRGAQVNYERSTPWQPVTPSKVTSNYGSASAIADGWTVVGSGVSYAAPTGGGTGLLSYGSTPATGQPALSSGTGTLSPSQVTPLPSTQSAWRPIASSDSVSSSAVDDVCENCPRDRNESSSPTGEATPWKAASPDADATAADRELSERAQSSTNRSRTQVTPADESPRLPARTERQRIESRFDSDPYRFEPVREQDNSLGLTPVQIPSQPDAIYRPPHAIGVNDDPVRPAITRDNSHRSEAVAQPAPAQPLPYLKPIPDLNRSRQTSRPETQQPITPIPRMLDDSEERTVRGKRVAPNRKAVPIDWTLVDIGRQGNLTRVQTAPSVSRQTTNQVPMIKLTPARPGDEVGPVEQRWRRVR